MKNSTHFDDFTLKWVIQGLLRSDLVTDEKRKVLEDFLNNKVVLAEIADILNMRIELSRKMEVGSSRYSGGDPTSTKWPISIFYTMRISSNPFSCDISVSAG